MMTEGVEMNTQFLSASSAFNRFLTGQNVFLTDFQYTGETGQGTVALGTDFPSKILTLDLKDHPGSSLICQRGAFLACNAPQTVDITTEMSHSLTAGFFGGQGFILQRLQGEGQVMVKAGGTVVRKELQEGEVLRVTSGSIVAFESTCQYNVEMMKGIQNTMFGGEGLFVTTLTGPGTVWLQGMPPDRMISEIARRVPAGAGGIGFGVPLGGGGSSGAEDAAAESGGIEGGDEAAAATAASSEAAIDADRQATVATSGMSGDDDAASVDSDSPEALFGDAAGKSSASDTIQPESDPFSSSTSTDSDTDSFSNAPSSSETTFTDDGTTTSWGGSDDAASSTAASNSDNFGNDDSSFWGDNNSTSSGPADGELFDDGGSDLSDAVGGDDEEGGLGSVVSTLWDMFMGGDD